MPETKVLIVEDEILTALHIADLLEPKGFVVLDTISTGESAIVKTDELKPDIILIDIMLQGKIDGITAIEKIKTRHDIPFIFITAHSDEKTLERVKPTEPQGYILKPINRDELYLTIEIALYKHEIKRKLKESELNLSRAEQMAHIGNWNWDIVKNSIIWSNEMYKIYGLNGDSKPTNEYVKSIIHPDDLETFNNAFKETLEHNNPPEFIEYRILPSNNKEKHVKSIAKAVFDKNGNAIKMFGTVQDITERKKADEAEKQFSIKWKNTFNAINDGILLIDLEYKILECNKSMINLTGKTHSEIVGSKCYEIMHGTSEPIESCPVARMKQTGQGEDTILKIDNKWFCVTADPQFDDDNNIVGAVHIISDITERKIAEKEIEYKMREMNTFINNIPHMAWLKDSDSNFIIANHKFGDVVGMDPEYLKSHSCAVCFGEETAEKFKDDDRLVLEGKKKITIEEAIVDKDGKKIFLETTKSPIFNNTGDVTGTVGIAINITDRKQTEEALRKSDEKVNTFMENSTDASSLYDSNLNLIELNKVGLAMFPEGTRKEDLIGKSLLEIEPDLKGTEKHRDYLNVIKTGNPLIIENFIPNPKWGDLVLSVRLFKVDNGLGMIVSDITERKKAEEQIKASLHEKEILLQEIHHRVKNNMQVISSLLNLQSKYISDEKDRQIFSDSQNRVTAMAMIHEKIYLSKDLANIEFTEYMQDLTKILFTSYNISPHDIELKIDAKHTYLDINSSIPCALIINELVSNSLKHAFRENMDRIITIEFKKDKKNIYYLSVSDNGIGFPEDLDYKNTDSLGLRIVKALTGQLNGEIKQVKTKGTRFVITFPV